MSSATSVGGRWTQSAPGVWSEPTGVPASGSIRRLDPSTGNLVSVNGHPFEIALPSNPLGPCTLNGSRLLSCSGGNFEHIDVHAHDAGVFVVDITARFPGVLIHLEDVANFPAFDQLAVKRAASSRPTAKAWCCGADRGPTEPGRTTIVPPSTTCGLLE